MNKGKIDFDTIYREFKIFVVWAKKMQEAFDEKFASLSANLDDVNGKCDKLISEREYDKETSIGIRKALYPVVVLNKIDGNVNNNQRKKQRAIRTKPKNPAQAVGHSPDISITNERVEQLVEIDSRKCEEPTIMKMEKTDVIEENICVMKSERSKRKCENDNASVNKCIAPKKRKQAPLKNYFTITGPKSGEFSSSTEPNLQEVTDSTINVSQEVTDSTINVSQEVTESTINVSQEVTDSTINVSQEVTDSTINVSQEVTDNSISFSYDETVLSQTIVMVPEVEETNESFQKATKKDKMLKKRYKRRKNKFKSAAVCSDTDSEVIIESSSDQIREHLENLNQIDFKYSQEGIGILEMDMHLLNLEFINFLQLKCENEEDVIDFFDETKRIMSEMLRINKQWKHVQPQAVDFLNKNKDLFRKLIKIYVEAISNLENTQENNLMKSLKGWPNVSLITFRIEVDSYEQEIEDFLDHDFFDYDWKNDQLRTSLWDKFFILEREGNAIDADSEELLGRLKSAVHKINLIDILFEQPNIKLLDHFGAVELIKKNCSRTGLSMYHTVHQTSTAESLNEHLQILEKVSGEYLNRPYDKEHFFVAQRLCTRNILIGYTAEKINFNVRKFKKVSEELCAKVSEYYESTAPINEVKRNLEMMKTKNKSNAKYANLFLGSKRLKLSSQDQVSNCKALQTSPQTVELSHPDILLTVPQPDHVQASTLPGVPNGPTVLQKLLFYDVTNALPEVNSFEFSPVMPQVPHPGIAPTLPDVTRPVIVSSPSVTFFPVVVPQVSRLSFQPHNSRPFILPKPSCSFMHPNPSLPLISSKVSHPVRKVKEVSDPQPSTSHSAVIITEIQPTTSALNLN